MFDPRVSQVVDQARPKDRVTLVVSVKARPDFEEVKKIRDASGRREALARFYSDYKKQVLSEVMSGGDRGFRIVSELTGTHQLIISAPATTWKQVMTSPGSAFADNGVHVRANEPAYALP